jgi:hypothetical protein
MPKVIKRFRDRYTKKIYKVGDSYSHENNERVASLIERGFLEEKSKKPPEEENDEFPKHTGGGYYELSDGSKVKGKEEAEEAQVALESGE